MNIRINSSFKFRIAGINYSNDGEICITPSSDELPQQEQCRYSTLVSSGEVESKKSVSLLQYATDYAKGSPVKEKTKDSYHLMCNHLENYGDTSLDKVTTAYLQGFISHLQSTGIKPDIGTTKIYADLLNRSKSKALKRLPVLGATC